jgi:hypothetical protein
MMNALGHFGISGAKVGDDGPLSNGARPSGIGNDTSVNGEVRSITHACDGRLASIKSLWASKRHGRRIPKRADLDPAEFYQLWPISFLLEWDPALSDWIVRFAGSAYGAVYGREITGARVSEIVPQTLAPQVLSDLRLCSERQEPILIDGETSWPDRGNVYQYQRVLLPFGDGGGKVTHLLGVAAFFNSAGATVF